MEENKSLSFDQLPSAVGELLTKVNTMMTRLDAILSTFCVWKSHATLTPLAKQDCPLWLQYD